jgi:hypothetical protein
MDYNTQREKLILPEYGRNIQNMVDHAITIKDREERNLAAQTIISVMGNLNPHLRENRDFKHKLWDHLHFISNFQLEIDSPFDPPEKDQLSRKPDALPYPAKEIKYKHYGKIVEYMIEKAIKLDDGEAKDEFVRFIANHMKLSHITWNKEGVADDVIFKAIKALSNGQLKVKEGVSLVDPKEVKPQKKKKGKSHHQKNGGR